MNKTTKPQKPTEKRQLRLRQLRVFASSIRFRIATVYSLTIFSLAALTLSIIYWAFSRSLGSVQLIRYPVLFSANQNSTEDDLYVARLEQIEELANERALENLGNYSLIALMVFFVISMVVGWVVAGRALKPIREITSVAKGIQASQDFSSRIEQDGPEDEIKILADTFDDMLRSLESAFEEKVKALEANRNFVRESSHELRNPLQIIRTNLQVTLADESASIDDYKETVDVVTKAIDRMSQVIEDLTKSEHYKSTHEGHDILDLSVLVSQLGAEFEKPTQSKGIDLIISAGSVQVRGDEESLKGAVANLLTNAMEAIQNKQTNKQFTKQASNQHPHIYLSSEAKNGSAIISVEDNGVGISPEDRERIFIRYVRGTEKVDTEKTSTEITGTPKTSTEPRPEQKLVQEPITGQQTTGQPETGQPQAAVRGLGLTIVRQVVEAHGGNVELFSEPGEKTIFSIRLPLLSQPKFAEPVDEDGLALEGKLLEGDAQQSHSPQQNHTHTQATTGEGRL